MGLMEIIFMILGICLFIAGFVIPEHHKEMNAEDQKMGEEQIRELVNNQLKDVKDKISDLVDETANYAVEKSERALERISNEKIMAVNEYSDTVMEAIHKNHEEVVFLYDMLNDKHENLKETVSQVEKTAKQVRESAEENAKTAEKEKEKTVQKQPEIEIKEPAPVEFVPLMPEAVTTQPVNADMDNMEKKEKPKKKATRKTAAKSERNNQETEKEAAPTVTLSFAHVMEDGHNNNEKILSLHKEGKSNMAIAKELGLGIGEVKLVIDLFEGI